MSIASASVSQADGRPAVDVIPLGGLGEFGLNMMAVATQATTLLVDAGVMFQLLPASISSSPI